MSLIQRAANLGRLWEYLAGMGYEMEEIRDFSTIEDIVKQLGKPRLMPMSSPSHNDFTEAEILYLLARRKGNPAILVNARLDDIGLEPVDRYWRRSFSRAFGAGGREEVIGGTPNEIVSSLTGRLVYFGDLFVSTEKEVRGNRKALRAFAASAHLAAAVKWQPNWSYSFIKEKNIMRGAANLYGFNRIFGSPFHWISEPVVPFDETIALAAVADSDLDAITDMTLRAIGKSQDSEAPKGAILSVSHIPMDAVKLQANIASRQ